ncbi:L-rhamnose/proton symporter RhaT [Neolewinella agarilytica]|uniref:L-rhamnose-H+ transport protein n=1 Tax=Neolewinella agarilytica TaxID=478744 RepID=A0A1H9D0J3_9BACT|nr:L-rhamnose/proton symporter RhaT [Neolewinella agarilytica]SEQ06899.1 L-rhamnose-H+ transport protein [Neolewinella agarilytica]
MTIGILTAIAAGIMLGLYALPEKYAKDFEFENTWGMMFFINMLIVPVIACLLLVDDFGGILGSLSTEIYLKMGVAALAWGVGVMLWGKAINYIGLSLGFSIFIGTVILVGSLLPFMVDELPASNVLFTILGGLLIVLLGIVANGKAGMVRQEDEQNSDTDTTTQGSMGTGIGIAVGGGLLATGFSYANAAGRPAIHEAAQAAGNPEWVTAVIVMFVIYVAGALFVMPYFYYQLTKKSLWSKFKTPALGRNLMLTSAMGILNFAASVTFAYAAYQLGKAGNTVGYAIFNTVCVAVAILTGLFTGEWAKASGKAKTLLYVGLAAMVVGVLVIAAGNGMAS